VVFDEEWRGGMACFVFEIRGHPLEQSEARESGPTSPPRAGLFWGPRATKNLQLCDGKMAVAILLTDSNCPSYPSVVEMSSPVRTGPPLEGVKFVLEVFSVGISRRPTPAAPLFVQGMQKMLGVGLSSIGRPIGRGMRGRIRVYLCIVERQVRNKNGAVFFSFFFGQPGEVCAFARTSAGCPAPSRFSGPSARFKPGVFPGKLRDHKRGPDCSKTT